MPYNLELYTKLADKQISLAEFRQQAVQHGIYPDSIHQVGEAVLFLAKEPAGKKLVIINPDTGLDNFTGQTTGDDRVKTCPADKSNLAALWQHFPFTRPTSSAGNPVTIGLGDRLGLATPGHIRAIRDLPVFPILAQQSMRELNFTGRTYADVLSSAAWAVFQEGYTGGYGADGDHLKSAKEISMALATGMTMITLDCSDYIDNAVEHLTEEQVLNNYLQLAEMKRNEIQNRYLGKVIRIDDDLTLVYRETDLMKLTLIYHQAIDHIINIYRGIISNTKQDIDFEISIDETKTPTSPLAHYFVASELKAAGVACSSIAPRFCGEFQKGIDYIGDKTAFTAEFASHVIIARHFAGYKLSIHSGSDKFSIFPVIGKLTGQHFHLKTAGTSWLEAVRVIARRDPALYREIHMYALEHLEEAKKHYVINTDPEKVNDISQIPDSELVSLMDIPDARQLIHISYGNILDAVKEDGSSRFKDRMYKLWDDHEQDYADALVKHIGRHLSELGIK